MGLGQEVPLETGYVHAQDTRRGRNWRRDEDSSKKITGRSYIDGEGAFRVISKSCTYILRQPQIVDHEGQVEEHEFCETVPHVMQRPHTRC